jgi:hypothetical protein
MSSANAGPVCAAGLRFGRTGLRCNYWPFRIAEREKGGSREVMRGVGQVVALVAALFVAGCAGTIKEGMSELEGKSVKALIDKIGLPIEERKISGQEVYVWGTPSYATVGAGEKICQIRAFVDGDIVRHLEYRGDEWLCGRYAARLR